MSFEYDEFLDNLLQDTEGDANLLSVYEDKKDLAKTASYDEEYEDSTYNVDESDHFAAIIDAEDNLPDDVKASLDTLAFLESVNLVKSASLASPVYESEIEADYEEYDEEVDPEEEAFLAEYFGACDEDIQSLEKSANLDELTEEEIYEWAYYNALNQLEGGM